MNLSKQILIMKERNILKKGREFSLQLKKNKNKGK